MRIHEIISQAILNGSLKTVQLQYIQQLFQQRFFDSADEFALQMLNDSIRDRSVTIEQNEDAQALLQLMA